MNDTWDLSILYKDFDDPAFTGDMAALDAAIRSMNDLAVQAATLPHADLVHRYVDNQLQLTTLISKLFIFCSLRTIQQFLVICCIFILSHLILLFQFCGKTYFGVLYGSFQLPSATKLRTLFYTIFNLQRITPVHRKANTFKT